MARERMSRRRFLSKAAAAAAGLGILGLGAQCGPTPTPEVIKEVVEKVVTKEVVKEVVKEVEVPAPVGEPQIPYLTDLWLWQKVGWALATDQYNMDHRGELRMVVDPVPSGFETKVREMITRQELKWDGKMRVRNREDAYLWYKMGIMDAVEPYIAASKVAWAENFFDELLPPLREMYTIEGKLWYIPWDVEVFVRHYRVPEWEETLGEGPAETLADFNLQLLELKKAYPNMAPLCLAQNVGQDYQMLMQLWTDELWVKEGEMWLPNYKSEAYKEYLNLYKFWYENGIITDESWGPGWKPLWNKGGALTTQTGAAWGFAEARKVWGREAIDCEAVPVLEKGDPPKTFIFSNASSIFVGAKNPQEVVDWQLWVIDPTIEKVANYSFYKGDLNYYHLPAFKTAYETIVPTNPDWLWMNKVMASVENAQVEPLESYPIMIGAIRAPWERKYAMGQATLDEVVSNLVKTTREQLEKHMAEL